MQEIWDPTRAPQIWIQYHNQLELYLRLAGNRGGLAILDVGCAQGTLALLLAERDHAVWAVDIREQFLRYAESRHERGEVHFVRANALELELDRRFDLIYCNQMLEHIVYPVELVSRLRSLLKASGRLVVTTPSQHYFKNTLPTFTSIGDPESCKTKQHSADADGHFFAYSRHELGRIFREAGFMNVAVSKFETPWVSGHCKIRYAQKYLPGGALRAADRITLGLPCLGHFLAHQLIAVGKV